MLREQLRESIVLVLCDGRRRRRRPGLTYLRFDANRSTCRIQYVLHFKIRLHFELRRRLEDDDDAPELSFPVSSRPGPFVVPSSFAAKLTDTSPLLPSARPSDCVVVGVVVVLVVLGVSSIRRATRESPSSSSSPHRDTPGGGVQRFR